MPSKTEYGNKLLSPNEFIRALDIAKDFAKEYKYVLMYGLHKNAFNCNMNILSRFTYIEDNKLKYDYSTFYYKDMYQLVNIIYAKTLDALYKRFADYHKYYRNTIVTLYTDNNPKDYTVLRKCLKKADFKPQFQFDGNYPMTLYFKGKTYPV